MTALRILVKVGDKVVPVEFHWDLIYPNSGIRGCSFSTDDAELQKALESHEFFGRQLQPSFWTDDKEEVAPVEKKETVKVDETPAPTVEETPLEKTGEPTTEQIPAPAEETPAEEVTPENEEVTVEPTPETVETTMEETPAEETAVEKETKADNEFPEVTKMAEVRTILKEKYGKTAAEVKSNAQVLALINELGLVFPNLK